MALAMNKTKAWPDRATLVEFGAKTCGVGNPAEIIDQIIDAALGYQPVIEPGPIWNKVRVEIERGCSSLRDSQVLLAGAQPSGPTRRRRIRAY